MIATDGNVANLTVPSGYFLQQLRHIDVFVESFLPESLPRVSRRPQVGIDAGNFDKSELLPSIAAGEPKMAVCVNDGRMSRLTISTSICTGDLYIVHQLR